MATVDDVIAALQKQLASAQAEVDDFQGKLFAAQARRDDLTTVVNKLVLAHSRGQI